MSFSYIWDKYLVMQLIDAPVCLVSNCVSHTLGFSRIIAACCKNNAKSGENEPQHQSWGPHSKAMNWKLLQSSVKLYDGELQIRVIILCGFKWPLSHCLIRFFSSKWYYCWRRCCKDSVSNRATDSSLAAVQSKAHRNSGLSVLIKAESTPGCFNTLLF